MGRSRIPPGQRSVPLGVGEPKALIDAIDRIGARLSWSRSKTVRVLLEQGLSDFGLEPGDYMVTPTVLTRAQLMVRREELVTLRNDLMLVAMLAVERLDQIFPAEPPPTSMQA